MTEPDEHGLTETQRKDADRCLKFIQDQYRPETLFLSDQLGITESEALLYRLLIATRALVLQGATGAVRQQAQADRVMRYIDEETESDGWKKEG